MIVEKMTTDMSVDGWLDTKTVDKISVDKIIVDKMTVNEMTRQNGCIYVCR
jgi:hypothetical protein